MWPSSLLISPVLVCSGTLSCCLSPHQCQTPQPCFLDLFLLLVPSSSFQFLCSSPHIRFTPLCPGGCLESGMPSWWARSHFSRERGGSAAHPPACVSVLTGILWGQRYPLLVLRVPFRSGGHSSRWQERTVTMMMMRRGSERYQLPLSFPAAWHWNPKVRNSEKLIPLTLVPPVGPEKSE